jgi:hypothetical protein
MNDDLQFIISENEILREEMRKEKVFTESLKLEQKNIKNSMEKTNANLSSIKRAILIKSREINKHKLNIKTNDMKLKGVVSSLEKTCNAIISEESISQLLASEKRSVTERHITDREDK